MRAFFEARIEHLTIADRVRVECLGRMPAEPQAAPGRGCAPDGSHCNRVVLIAVQGLNQPGWLPISELGRHLRCDNCGERGHVDLTIVWAGAKPP
jgi:hypothetical protein